MSWWFQRREKTPVSELEAGIYLGRKLAEIDARLERLEQMAGTAQEQLQAIKEAQAGQKAALDNLGSVVTTETTQINAKLKELQDQIDAGVSGDQLQPVLDDLVASNQRLADAGGQISGIIPDAP
jgi:chromosome segregation ATPase